MPPPDGPPAVDVLRVAEAALLRYALGGSRLVPLAESFNTVFRVDTADSAYVLRVGPGLRVHPAGAVHGEAAWTRQLARGGVRVPQLVLTADGDVSVVITTDDRAAGRECSLWTWVPGEPVGQPLVDADVHRLAALSARLHAATPPVAEAPLQVLTARSVLWFDVPDVLAELASSHRDVLLAARDRAQAAIERLWRTADTAPRLVHGDLTPSNVVRHDGALFAIDCQDLSWAHVEQDLAHSIYGITRGVDLAAGLAAFRAGYERVRRWPRLDVPLLIDLVAARRVSMVNLAVLRARPDLGAYAARHAAALRNYAR